MSAGEKRYREFEAVFTVRFNADDQTAADRKLKLYSDIIQRLVKLQSASVNATDLT